MNKQQLASKIWASANKMRSKIEANEYKDYILGFIFYKFISDKLVELLWAEGWSEADMKQYLVEENEEMIKYCQDKRGYFIAYNDLFSTWINPLRETPFTVGDVRDALNRFARLIKPTYARVYAGTAIRDSVLMNSERELYLCRQKESWVITSLCPMSIQRHGRVTRINARQTAISH